MTTAGRWREPNPNLTTDAKVAWTAPARTGIQAWVGTVGGKKVASIRRHPAHLGSACTASIDGWVWNNAGNPLGGPEAPARGFPSVPQAKKAIAAAIRLHPGLSATVDSSPAKCFACGRKLGASPRWADTRDDQRVLVGRECAKPIEHAGEHGWQPPKGGPRLYPLIRWTDAPRGSAGHAKEKLVCQIRALDVGGWSARWGNGMHWDVRDQLTLVEDQSSRHFSRRELAKKAVEEAIATGKGLA